MSGANGEHDVKPFSSPNQIHQQQQSADEYQQQQQAQAHQSHTEWDYSGNHADTLPANVINAYANNFAYPQQPVDPDQEAGQHEQQDQPDASLPFDPDSMYDASADDSAMAGFDTTADGGDGMTPDDGESSRKRSKTGGGGRVAKACTPCSSKKRRCDGGKPECQVCKVLGTPCSYNPTGLKRGPPKGFRGAPKESARAKITRTLETTIRDLTTQLGQDEALKEILRVSRERGIVNPLSGLDGSADVNIDAFNLGSNNEFGVTQRAIEQSLAQDDSFLAVNERGDLTHRGGSSGIQLLRGNAGSAGSPPHGSPGGSANSNMPQPSQPMIIPIPSPNEGNQFKDDPNIIRPFLEAVGGFQDPYVSPEESHRLFDNYWRSFHPYWPILYKAILDDIPPNEVASRLDGLLLNAIYAIGCSGRVNGDAHERAQSGSLDAARRSGHLYAQAAERRLYASGLRPTVSAIQASFMLSVFNHGTGELSRAWSFCGIAINMAMDLGLHRWPIHRFDLLKNSAERETRTRTIWSLYVLDKILCAEMGRSPILRAREMDPPLLSEDAPDEMEYMDGNPARPMRIASCFNAAVSCFAILERILTEVHSLRRKAVLRQGQVAPDILNELDAELEKWTRKLPDHLRIPEDYSSPEVGFPGIVWALGVWEATATILLHRPFIPQASDDNVPSLEEVTANPSHQKATAAADRLCRLLNLDIGSRPSDYDVALWPSDYAYCLFTAAVMYLFNARVGIEGARRKFALSRDQLKRLSSRWPTASAQRQLLDGFTAVADDALGCPEPNHGEPTQPQAEGESAFEVLANAPGQDAGSVFGARFQGRQNEFGMPEQQGGVADGPAGVFARMSTDGLSDEQRQQLLTFYMDSSHRFGPQDQSRRQMDHFAPGLFDVETAFWNETAGSNTLSNAFGQGAPQGQYAGDVSGGEQQDQEDGEGRTHHGLAMLAALAPHAAPHQQGQMQGPHHAQQQQQQQLQQQQQQRYRQSQHQDPSQPGASDAGHLNGHSGGQDATAAAIAASSALAAYQPVQQQLQAAQQQASPFAFSLDPGQPAWNDPIMSALDLGRAYAAAAAAAGHGGHGGHGPK